MCIIVYKPKGIKMPDRKTLKTCWTNNPDGAGYMYPSNNQVIIKKGFMSFDEFHKNLIYDYLRYGVGTDFVMHFRISTQGGVNKQCCHPFPLSKDMNDLKCTRAKSKIGVAHNGIIDLTTEYYSVRSTITYSDTMKFITDYLSLIIKDNNFYKDDDTLELIERLAESKLAIMDGTGHTTLIGKFEKDNGVYYSNEYYKVQRHRRATTVYTSTTNISTTTTNTTTNAVNKKEGTIDWTLKDTNTEKKSDTEPKHITYTRYPIITSIND